jgi:hypothetical protein
MVQYIVLNENLLSDLFALKKNHQCKRKTEKKNVCVASPTCKTSRPDAAAHREEFQVSQSFAAALWEFLKKESWGWGWGYKLKGQGVHNNRETSSNDPLSCSRWPLLSFAFRIPQSCLLVRQQAKGLSSSRLASRDQQAMRQPLLLVLLVFFSCRLACAVFFYLPPSTAAIMPKCAGDCFTQLTFASILHDLVITKHNGDL